MLENFKPMRWGAVAENVIPPRDADILRGMSLTLLSKRLKDMQESGLVQREAKLVQTVSPIT